MITPVSATATDMLKPSHQSSQMPPTSAKGSESMTMKVSVSLRKFR